ncbi:MAG: hypothetical protein NWR72_16065, partial [Bacteroidia bacterium]|nr:hypothetical protein [Bacteroidia bacterium]
MKHARQTIGLIFLMTSLSTTLLAQSPQGFSYQAVVRDGGAVLANELVAVEFTVEENGNVLYRETHSVSTNEFGLLTAVIGQGAVLQGDFQTLDWGSGAYELNVKMNTGNGLQDLGTSALQSVPYSLYSQRAYTVDSLNLTDLRDVSNSLTAGQILQWTGSEWVTVADQVNDADANPTNEIQTLSISGNSLSISGGNSISLPAGAAYTAGTGISISGAVISNTAPDQTVSLTGAGATNVSGTYPNFTITSTDNNTTYTAGTGISLSGTTINNTGDTNASDDITTGSAAGGDLAGTYPNPQVAKIRGNTVSATAPASGQVLKWNGTQWAPAADNAGSSVWSTSGTNAYYNAGNVGLGTTTPAASFAIDANSSLSDPHILLHEDGNDYARINFDNNNGSNYWTIAAYIATNNRNDRLNFWNGTGGDVMTITGDGEVGIGVG